MRIIYVTAQTPWGGEEFILPEILAMRKAGHKVTVIPVRPSRQLAPGTEAREVQRDAVALPLLGFRTIFLALAETGRRPLLAIKTLARVVRATNGWRKLAKNMLVFPKALALAHTARLLKADHIHAHWASTTATAAYVASSMSGIPWSFTAHRWDIQEDNMLKEKVRTASFVRVINKRGLTEIDRIVGYELSRKVRVIHMGVDTEKYGPARFGLPNTSNDKTPLIVCPANFVPVKGHRYLLDALAQVKLKGLSFKCWFFGAGPLEDALKRQTAELCLTDYVDFRGRLPHPELLELFNSGLVDIVVLPSIVTKDGACEGIPVALMEAMAAGIPVVSTRTGGIPELVEGAGLLVDPADSTELASAIMELIGNPELRLKLAEAGRSAVQRDFSLSSIVLQLSESMASGVGGFLPPNLDKAGQKEVRLQ